MASFHTIVVAVDLSPASADALDVARDLADLSHARLHVIHVVADPFHSMYAVETSGLDLPVLLEQWTAAAQQQLEDLVGRHPIGPGRLTTSILAGSPAQEIVRYAADQQADVIVLGSHGRAMVGRLLLGSVADRVLHHAGRSVLVVPHRTGHVTSFEMSPEAAVGAPA
jgi:nucleotide-binding universal stress UspA family protein